MMTPGRAIVPSNRFHWAVCLSFSVPVAVTMEAMIVEEKTPVTGRKSQRHPCHLSTPLSAPLGNTTKS